MISTWNVALAAADGAERAADVPGRVGPPDEQPLDLAPGGPRWSGRGRCADGRASRRGPGRPPARARARRPRTGRRARRSPGRCGRARRRRRAGRRRAGRFPAVGDLLRRTRSNTLVVTAAGARDRHGPGTTVGACSARRRCRAPWQGWLATGLLAGVAALGPGRPRRPPTTPRAPPAGPDAATGAADALDHAGLHPRPRARSSSVAPSPTPPTRSGRRSTSRASSARRRSPPRAELAAAAAAPVDRRRRSPDHRPGHLRQHRLPAAGRVREASRSACRAPRSPVSAPGRLLVRRPRAREQRRRAALTAGRDRTFLPLVPPAVTNSGGVEQTSLVAPGAGRASIHAPDGTVEDLDRWLHSLRAGPLHDVVATGRAAARTAADLGRRPGRGRRRTPARRGQPPRTLVAPSATNPGRRHLVRGRRRVPRRRARGLDERRPGPADPRRWLARAPTAGCAGCGPVLVGRHRPGDGPALRRPRRSTAPSSYDRPLAGRAAIHRTGHTLSPWSRAPHPGRGATDRPDGRRPPSASVPSGDHRAPGGHRGVRGRPPRRP